MIVNTASRTWPPTSASTATPGRTTARSPCSRCRRSSAVQGPEQVCEHPQRRTRPSPRTCHCSSAGGGSSVVHGNLLTLPVGNSFLYVEPLYVQGRVPAAALSRAARVLVVYGDKIGYGATLTAALANLAKGDHGSAVCPAGPARRGRHAVTARPSTSAAPSSPSPSTGAGWWRLGGHAAAAAERGERTQRRDRLGGQDRASRPRSPTGTGAGRLLEGAGQQPAEHRATSRHRIDVAVEVGAVWSGRSASVSMETPTRGGAAR